MLNEKISYQIIRSQDGPAAIRHEGEEEGAAGGDGASIAHGGCRVTLR